jgi:DNA-directed RNA polymerase subunit RPC12/RpoP
MQSRTIGLVLLLVGGGVALWLAAGLATGRSVTGIALGFVLFSLPFLAVGLYFLLQSQGEIAQQSRADKQRNILNAVTTRGRVSVADLAIENDASRDEVRDHVYDLIGKDLFRGFVNWERGELVSAEAAEIREDTCPNCGGRLELAGKGLVRCPYCGTETFLSGPPSRTPTTPEPSASGEPPSST